jgi:hypothetical protein
MPHLVWRRTDGSSRLGGLFLNITAHTDPSSPTT